MVAEASGESRETLDLPLRASEVPFEQAGGEESRVEIARHDLKIGIPPARGHSKRVILNRGTRGSRALPDVPLQARGDERPGLRLFPLRAFRHGPALRPLPAAPGAHLSPTRGSDVVRRPHALHEATRRR